MHSLFQSRSKKCARYDKRPTKVHNILLYANTGGKRRKGVRAQKVALSNIDITGGFKNR